MSLKVVTSPVWKKKLFFGIFDNLKNVCVNAGMCVFGMVMANIHEKSAQATWSTVKTERLTTDSFLIFNNNNNCDNNNNNNSCL